MDRKFVEEAVEEQGEVHVVVEEHESVLAGSDEDYIGLRKGEGYDYGPAMVKVKDGSTTHYIPYDSIVYLHTPAGFPD